MKQLTLFDTDDFSLRCPYCRSNLLEEYTNVEEGYIQTTCLVCNKLLRKVVLNVQDKPST